MSKKHPVRVDHTRRKSRIPEEARKRIRKGGTHRSKKDYDRNQGKRSLLASLLKIICKSRAVVFKRE